MLKTLFEIGADAGEEKSLLLEIGRGYFCYAFWNSSLQTIYFVRYLSFNETEAEEAIHQLIESFSDYHFQSVAVCSAFPQAILTPGKFSNDSYEILQTIYNEPAQVYKNNRIEEWQLVNVYSLPEGMIKALENSFSNIRYLHTYTTALKIYNGYVADNQALINFTPQYFSVIIKKDSAIQLAQTYYYNSPLDVIYYLLKICSEFKIEISSLFIILSGLIEKDSALFKELGQYFFNVHFAQPSPIKFPETDYPHYFFTSLYNLATCVSLVDA